MTIKWQHYCIYTWPACWNLSVSGRRLYKGSGQRQALSQIPVWLLPNHQSMTKAVELVDLDLVPPVRTPCFVPRQHAKDEKKKQRSTQAGFLCVCFHLCSTSNRRYPAIIIVTPQQGFFCFFFNNNVGEVSTLPSTCPEKHCPSSLLTSANSGRLANHKGAGCSKPELRAE